MAIRKNLEGSSGGLAHAASRALLNDTANLLTAAGTTQATAFLMTQANNVFTTVAAGSGALLNYVSDNGDEYQVDNLGANALLVYPPLGAQIGLNGTNNAVTIASGKRGTFKRISLTQWVNSLSA